MFNKIFSEKLRGYFEENYSDNNFEYFFKVTIVSASCIMMLIRRGHSCWVGVL